MEEPLPFIQFEDDKFVMDARARELLCSIKGKIAVVVVAGPYRTGKSYLLNQLIQSEMGFQVASTIKACTKGIWLWGQPIKKGDTTYIFLDSEGLGSTDQTNTFDTKIFSLGVLLSSLFIFNTSGTINEYALEQLDLVVQCSKHIKVSPSNTERKGSNSGASSDSEDPESLAPEFPRFLWVLRDFHLELVDDAGNPITSTQYLEDALRPMAGRSQREDVKEKDRIRGAIRSVFQNRECVTLLRPVLDEKFLHSLSHNSTRLRPEFVDQINSLRRKVFKTAGVKAVNGQQLNGSHFVGLAAAYINCLNVGGIPVIQSAWQSVVKEHANRAFEVAIEYASEEISKYTTNSDAVLFNDELHTAVDSIYRKARAMMQSLVVSDTKANEKLERKLHNHIMAMKKNWIPLNDARSETSCRRLIQSLYDSSGIDDAEFQSAKQLNEALKKLSRMYQSRAKGPKVDVVASEFMDSKKSQMIQDLFESVGQSATENERLEERIRNMQTEQERLTHLMDLQVAELESARKHQQWMQSQLDEQMRTANRYEIRCEELDQVLSEHKEASQTSQLERSNLNQKLKQVEQELRSARRQLKEGNQTSNKTIEDLRICAADDGRQIAQLQDENNTLSTRLETLQSKHKRELKMETARKMTFQAEAKRLEKELAKVTSELEQAEKAVTKASSSSSQNEADLKRLHEKINYQADLMAILTKENTQLEAQVAKLKKIVAEKKKQKFSKSSRSSKRTSYQQMDIDDDDDDQQEDEIGDDQDDVDDSNNDRRKRKSVTGKRKLSSRSSRATSSSRRRKVAVSPASSPSPIPTSRRPKRAKRTKPEEEEEEAWTRLGMDDDDTEDFNGTGHNHDHGHDFDAADDDEEEDDDDFKNQQDQEEKKKQVRRSSLITQKQVENPSKCTIQQLKSWLTSLDIQLPGASQPKQYYLEQVYQHDPDLDPKDCPAPKGKKGRRKKKK